jgi:ribonuclease P protein component
VNRRHRLRGSREFVAVRAWRAWGMSGPLRVHAGRNTVSVARVGFSIPRSQGGAVVRNRLRRRLRSLLQPRLPELAGIDLVVVAAPGAAAATSAELRDHLVRSVEIAVGWLRSGGDETPAATATGTRAAVAAHNGMATPGPPAP